MADIPDPRPEFGPSVLRSQAMWDVWVATELLRQMQWRLFAAGYFRCDDLTEPQADTPAVVGPAPEAR